MTEIICLKVRILVEKSADRTWKWRCDRTADRGRYEKKSEKCKNAAFGRKLCQSGKYAGDKTAGSFPVYQNKQKCEAEEQFRIFRIKYAYVVFRNKPWWRWWKILRKKYEENSNYRR